jgi:hypothetical protein
MLQLVKTISSEIDTLSRRVVKFLRYGVSDTRTSIEATPYGVDSSPIKGMVAVYADTSEAGKSVLIGYLNNKQLAESGEMRIYATNDAGAEQFSIHLKKTGICQVSGQSIEIFGVTDNAVKWIPLNAGLQAEAALINANVAAISANLVNLSAVVNGIIPSSVPTVYEPTPVTVDISGAKNDKVKFG